ncbi:MAG TPA: MBL fold metallo-hydrolase, partial [Bryobacteraceae bacterium]|nr:MBL fold metallo-hydrolase [Bryobacteraceae bacterium]
FVSGKKRFAAVAETPAIERIARDVALLRVSIANVYFVGRRVGPWALIDTGVPGKADMIREAANALFGPGTRPEAILLTHGHFDHAGSALELARMWGVNIYLHPLETPYVTGRSDYPPPDLRSGGFMALVNRLAQASTLDLEDRARPLGLNPDLPGLPAWQWIHVPGHAPGQIAFFRPEDRTLIAGDACATVNLDSLFAAASKYQRVCRPPAPMTCDWIAAAESVEKLAALEPVTLACGHGDPISGPAAAEQLRRLAREFRMPRRGRYVAKGAHTDESGVISLPPKPSDPLPKIAAGVGFAALAGTAIALVKRRRSKRENRD